MAKHSLTKWLTIDRYGGVPLEQALKESGDEELSQIIEFIAAKLHDLGETKTVVSALSGSNPKAAFHEQLKSLLTELCKSPSSGRNVKN